MRAASTCDFCRACFPSTLLSSRPTPDCGKDHQKAPRAEDPKERPNPGSSNESKGILGGGAESCGVTETRSTAQRIMAFPVLPPYTKCDLSIQDRFAQLDQGGKV